jgi:hypothetical protein
MNPEDDPEMSIREQQPYWISVMSIQQSYPSIAEVTSRSEPG